MDDVPVTNTASHSDSAFNGEPPTPADVGQGDELDRLRAALACGLVPDGQVRPLLELLDALRRAGGAEDRATVMYPGSEPLDVACRNGHVAASLLPALRVRDPGGLVVTGPTEEEMFRAARAEAEAFRAAQAARRAIEGRRPFRHGGGACALLVVRNGDQIELLPHAADSWAVSLDTAHALELRDALTELTLGIEP